MQTVGFSRLKDNIYENEIASSHIYHIFNSSSIKKDSSTSKPEIHDSEEHE